MISETSLDSLNIYKFPVFERCTSLVEQDLIMLFVCTVRKHGVLPSIPLSTIRIHNPRLQASGSAQIELSTYLFTALRVDIAGHRQTRAENVAAKSPIDERAKFFIFTNDLKPGVLPCK
ncbi:uncharacterized protein ARMOST_17632 [Armillaria ostoyae]|uniref:Uncharacterized protein n=1 Tax=Armillaria ostoyae TaxID=47428 RepID=A0A284RZP0_ARMOS|nr:uncharacterized protein ARMOST_17632 [Armillaria ostoyae]